MLPRSRHITPLATLEFERNHFQVQIDTSNYPCLGLNPQREYHSRSILETFGWNNTIPLSAMLEVGQYRSTTTKFLNHEIKNCIRVKHYKYPTHVTLHMSRARFDTIHFLSELDHSAHISQLHSRSSLTRKTHRYIGS